MGVLQRRETGIVPICICDHITTVTIQKSLRYLLWEIIVEYNTKNVHVSAHVKNV